MNFREDNFWARVIKRTDGCWGWSGFVDNKGYGRINAWVGDKRRSQGAHRVSYFLHYGEIPKGMHVLHQCDNPICTRPDHLRIGTHAENMRDKMERGRDRRAAYAPEKTRAAKLNWEKARAIRALKAAHPAISHDAIAAQYNVSRATISFLLEGKTWKEAEAAR